jgi:RND family efflux transporter MFP subunit
MRKIIIPSLAVIGVILAIVILVIQSFGPTAQKITSVLPISPYEHYVAGEGQIEALGRTVKIGIPFTEIIKEIVVTRGQEVKKGDPLLYLDTRQYQAQLHTAQEELKNAQTTFSEQNTLFNFYQSLKEKNAVSQKEYEQARYALLSAEVGVSVAAKKIEEIKMLIERSTITAPYDGTVLAINTQEGEIAQPTQLSQESYILFGDTRSMQLRVDIAEEDSWRIIKGAPGVAYVRGNARIKIPLSFLYIEPFMVAKKALTGSDTERVDTRVLQVIYQFDQMQHPVYAGQLLDVYVEAQPHHEK